MSVRFPGLVAAFAARKQRGKGRCLCEAQVSSFRGYLSALRVDEHAAVTLVAQMSVEDGPAQRRVTAVRWRTRLAAGLVVTAALAGCATSPQSDELPLRQVSETALTGGPVWFDYLALDAGRGDYSSPTWAQVNSSTLTYMHAPLCARCLICPTYTG